MGAIKAWSVDPQVKIDESGKQGSLYDALEDMDAEPCIAKAAELAKLNRPAPKNSAFVFIKPHAVTDKVKACAKAGLEKAGIKILKQGTIKAETIDKKKLIDQHYYAIASKATILKPDQLNVPEDKFKGQFGIEWKDALASGKVFNAIDGCAKLGIDGDEMEKAWAKCKADKKLIKFGGGFYCGLIELEGKDPLYIFNGFFMSMRAKYVQKGTSIYYYSVEWDPKELSWGDFREKVLGPTDPETAPKDSLRGEILEKWEELGLKAKPDVGDNGMHASASPFEAFSERNNWMKVPIFRDRFGSLMLSEGVPMETIKAWSVDPQVNLDAAGKKGSIYDALEDLDVQACIDKVVALSKLN
jgi:nucleoside diphosphate kinase